VIALRNIPRALNATLPSGCVCEAAPDGYFDFRPGGADGLGLITLLITSGFALAATGADGLPQHAPYAVIEEIAREERARLWQFSDLQQPAIALDRTRQTTGLGQ
jgi:hypothetical protein